MLSFTETAAARVRDFLEQQSAQGVAALRVAGTRREQRLWLVKASDRQQGDLVLECDGFDVYLDPLTVGRLDGAIVDFVEDALRSGFRVSFPSPTWDNPLAQRVQETLDQQVNPGVAGHGGSVSLMEVAGDVAVIRLHGGCQGCGAANLTLRQGIERVIKAAVPEIRAVRDATDHEAGENPYYARDAGPADVESPIG